MKWETPQSSIAFAAVGVNTRFSLVQNDPALIPSIVVCPRSPNCRCSWNMYEYV